MRLAIFSDVHANFEALTRVLDAYKNENIDKYICLGDVVGYGASPNRCCDLVRPLVDFSIMGNHDAAVCGKMDYNYYYEACRFVLDLHSSQLSKQNQKWLQQNPFIHNQKIDDFDICFSHGAPLEPKAFDYVFSLEQAYRLLPEFSSLNQINFIGHSHLCKAFALEKNDVHEIVAQEFKIRSGMKYIIGVGSVGQPRDYDNRAAYTIFDTKTGNFTYKRIEYDIEQAAMKIFKAKIDRNFANRLFVGV
ncbi:MAG: metallophosphoesterase family protein [Deltaproteobacteria bacterium]|jgi:predicted phosphodiesterase|nr:metallophosphoesterase family protein [Deltaproteobacteria bacterium]